MATPNCNKLCHFGTFICYIFILFTVFLNLYQKKRKILIEVKSKNSSSSSDKPKIKKRKGVYIDTSNL